MLMDPTNVYKRLTVFYINAVNFPHVQVSATLVTVLTLYSATLVTVLTIYSVTIVTVLTIYSATLVTVLTIYSATLVTVLTIYYILSSHEFSNSFVRILHSSLCFKLCVFKT
jgi:hypothetical protein